MRIDTTTPSLPRPIAPSSGAIEGTGDGKVNDTKDPNTDTFEPQKRTAWSDFMNGSSKTSNSTSSR